MPFACIFVPDFPVEAVLRAEPELRSQAVVVLEGKPPLQRVFGLNENARRAGLELGMTKLQVEPWPDLVLRNRSPLQENAAHAALLDCAQSFSPRIEDTACDTVVLDIDGMEALFGPPAKLARDLARRASELGIEANVAVASNPDAAAVAARGYPGVTVISAGEEQDRLGGLPLHVLFGAPTDESAQFLETLERWGIRNLRGFAALPELAISERLGERGVHLQRLARGTIDRTLVPVDPPLVFEEAMELEYPVILLEPLAFVLARLLEQLCARLSSRALATQELRLTLQLEPGIQAEDDAGPRHAGEACPERSRRGAPATTSDRYTIFERTLRLPLPMLDSKVFLKLLQLDLKAHPPGAPITKIWLAAEPARLRPGQGGLFQPPSPEPEKLELTLARIASIVGEDRVGSVELLDSYRPDAFRMQHFSVVPQGQNRKPKSTPAFSPTAVPKLRDWISGPTQPRSGEPTAQAIGQGSRAAQPRRGERTSDSYDDIVTALRMFRPRLQAFVTLRQGHPAQIACPKRKEVKGDVIWHAGPWRSSGDWWDQEPWARDEWDIAIQIIGGLALYRLVHDLLSGKWYVEGTYD